MTDEAKALVERLRNDYGDWVCDEAADLIETQAREIERLRAALDRIYMEDRRIVERWRQSFATGDSHLDEQIVLGRYADIARAALKGTDNDPE